MLDTKPKLGMEVKDRVTGYQGIAIARTEYLQGCHRILVQPKIDKDGKVPDPQAFDEPDLEVISYGILSEPPPPAAPGRKPGGPRAIASRTQDVGRR